MPYDYNIWLAYATLDKCTSATSTRPQPGLAVSSFVAILDDSKTLLELKQQCPVILGHVILEEIFDCIDGATCDAGVKGVCMIELAAVHD